MQWAPLVDAALGPVAQHIVLRDDGVLQAIESGNVPPGGPRWIHLATGRASVRRAIATTSTAATVCSGVWIDWSNRRRTCCRWSRQLLGRTWAVEMLEHARQLRAAGIDGVCLVTLAGEVVHSDGTVVAGPKDVGGLISRRTELRDLRREEAVLREQVDEGEQEIRRLRENIDQQQAVAAATDRSPQRVQSGTG